MAIFQALSEAAAMLPGCTGRLNRQHDQPREYPAGRAPRSPTARWPAGTPHLRYAGGGWRARAWEGTRDTFDRAAGWRWVR